jgi:hypothetical protein
MSRISVITLLCLCVLVCIVFGLFVFYDSKQPKYDITITEGNQQRVQNCDMPHGWKIITDGKNFSYETASGHRSIFNYESPLEVCEKANNYIGKFKRDWKYLK